MEDKGKGVVGGGEENLFSELGEGPSNMETDKEVDGCDGSDDNYDDEDVNSDEEGQLDDNDDEGDESEEGDELEPGSGIPSTFERLEYEALAEKKRKALADAQGLVFLFPFCFVFGYYVSRWRENKVDLVNFLFVKINVPEIVQFNEQIF